MIYSVLKEGIKDHTMKKSRFIGYASQVRDQEEAQEYIEKIKDLHPQARHHVSAYRLQDQDLIKYDDDKEPSQTAGRPILDLILHKDLTNICIVVVRYFGGILLGKGGLVKAYTLGAQLALEEAKIVPYKEALYLKLSFDYGDQGSLEYQLNERRVQILNRDYGAQVTFQVLIEEDKFKDLEDLVMDITSGRGQVQALKRQLLAYVDDQFIEESGEESK